MTKNTFILNFFKFYNIVWKLSLPFLKTAKRLKHGFEKRRFAKHHSKADIWIQAASAGEAYLAVNIIQTLDPATNIKILVTSTTSQGIDILKTRLTKKTLNNFIELKIEWFPFDMPDTIEAAVKAINPAIMVLLETEIWPALLYYLKKNKSKILIINARLSRKSFNHYLKTKFLWKHLAPDIILAVSSLDAKRYKCLFDNTIVKTMPNIKFESMSADNPDTQALEQIKTNLPRKLPLTILASVRKQEEKETILLIKEILKMFPRQIVAIFPRHMHRVSPWEKLLNSHNLNFHLRSKISVRLTNPGIILWDTFGELKTAYGLASIVFVGGSLKPLGGQNFIEPAVQGAVTVTGPYYDDFAWAGDEIFNKKIIIKKKSWQAVAKTISKTLENPVNKTEQILVTQNYIKSNQGGTLQACNEILKSL
ncbi:MAG: glycosyltransferase N-terminal domain-containing protein [Thermodesulfobacteriota bacterium]